MPTRRKIKVDDALCPELWEMLPTPNKCTLATNKPPTLHMIIFNPKQDSVSKCMVVFLQQCIVGAFVMYNSSPPLSFLCAFLKDRMVSDEIFWLLFQRLSPPAASIRWPSFPFPSPHPPLPKKRNSFIQFSKASFKASKFQAETHEVVLYHQPLTE